MWGDNRYGQIGNGSTEDQFTPAKILDHVKLPTSPQAHSVSVTQELMSLGLCAAVSYSNDTAGQSDFTALLPNETYNFYAVKDRNAADILNPANLLYITRAVSDNEGSVNSLDVVLIKRYLVGYEGLDLDKAAADVNGDGRVSSLDAVKILQKLAGYDVVLGEKVS